MILAGLAVGLLHWLMQREVAGRGVAIDGDSIRIEGRDVRLRGLDAPELRQICRGPGGEVACGRDARRALAALIDGGVLTCRVSGRDRYGRDLAHCRAGDVDVNAAMVRSGHAVSSGDFLVVEAEARAARRGIWSLAFDHPAEWREKHPRPATAP